MHRALLGLLGTLCLTVAVAHLTGALRYSEYPAAFKSAFAEPKEEKTTTSNVSSAPSTQPTTDTKPKPSTLPKTPPSVTANVPAEKSRPIQPANAKPDLIDRVTLADLPHIQNAHPASEPLVPKKPPTAPSMENYRVSAAAPKGQPIGYFPAGATITFRGKGGIAYGGRGTGGPIGDINLIMGPDPPGGRPLPLYHGALCLVVPADPSIKGFKPPSEWVPLPWKEIGGQTWEAVYIPERDMDLTVLVADSKYGDNTGWYDLTVEWSPGGKQ